MQIRAETRAVLRHYRQLINARRREDGMKALSTPQIVDEICEFMLRQPAVYLGGAVHHAEGQNKIAVFVHGFSTDRYAFATTW